MVERALLTAGIAMAILGILPGLSDSVFAFTHRLECAFSSGEECRRIGDGDEGEAVRQRRQSEIPDTPRLKP